MLLLNRAALQACPHPALVLAIQAAATALLLLPRWRHGVVTWARVRVALLYTAALFCSMAALQHVTPQTVILGRNANTVLVAVADALLLKTQITRRTVVAIATVVVGMAWYAAEAGRIEFSRAGLLFLGCNVAASTVYTLYTRSVVAGEQVDATATQTVLANLVVVGPMLALSARLYTGSEPVLAAPLLSAHALAIPLSAVAGTGIAYAGLKLQRLVSATSFTIEQNLNKLLTVVLSIALLDAALPPRAYLGMAVTFVGGYLYARDRYLLQQKVTAPM